MNDNKSKIIIGIIVVIIIIVLLSLKNNINYISVSSNKDAENVAKGPIEDGVPVPLTEDEYKYYKLTIKNLKKLSEDCNDNIDIDKLYVKTKEYIIKNNVFGCDELTYERVNKKSNGSYLIYLSGSNRTIKVILDNEDNYEFELVTE